MCIACQFSRNNNPVIIDDIIHDHYDNSHPSDDYSIVISCKNIRKLPQFILNNVDYNFNIRVINCPNLEEIRGLSNLDSIGVLSIEWSNKIVYRNLLKLQYIEICNENKRGCGSLLLRNRGTSENDDFEYYINDDISLIVSNYIHSIYNRKNNVLYEGDVNLHEIVN